MPLLPGKKHAAVAANIRELVRAGHEPKQAVAIALSRSRKMAKGGMVDEDDDEFRSLGDLMEQGEQPGIANPEEQMEQSDLAKALKKDEMAEEFAMGGLVEDGPSGDEPVGNKPSEDMASESEEPLNAEPVKPGKEEHPAVGLSELAMKELEERKKRRRFS